MEIIIVLAWIGCAYWCSQIAKRNGRNALIATNRSLIVIGSSFKTSFVVDNVNAPDTNERLVDKVEPDGSPHVQS